MVSPLPLQYSNKNLTFPLNLSMSCPYLTMKSSMVLNWILIWKVVVFISKWDSLIFTLSRRFPDLRCLMGYSSDHKFTLVVASTDIDFMIHLYLHFFCWGLDVVLLRGSDLID